MAKSSKTLKVNQLIIPFNRKDFSTSCAKSEKEKIFASTGISEPIVNFPYNLLPIRCYGENGNYYLYAKDKYLYKYSSSGANKVVDQTFSSEPVISVCTIQGEQKCLIICQNLCIVEGEFTTNLGLTLGEHTQVILNRIYTAKGNVAYCSENLENLSSGKEVEFSLMIEAPQEYGEIVGFGNIGQSIYVICKHGILRMDNHEYKDGVNCTLIPTEYLDVVTGSVLTIGGGIYFLSNNKIYRYIRSGLTEFDPFVEGAEYTLKAFGKWKEKYVVQLRAKRQYTDEFLIFDTLTNTHHFTYAMAGLSRQGGYVIEEYVGTFRVLSDVENLPALGVTWITTNLTFGESKPKTLLSVEFEKTGGLTLNVSGEFGSVNVEFDQQERAYKCNLTSSWFKFIIQTEVEKLPIEKLKVKYRVLGE